MKSKSRNWRCASLLAVSAALAMPDHSPAQDFASASVPDIAFRQNGLPLVAHSNSSLTIRLLECHVENCRVASDLGALDGGRTPSMVIRHDGRPIIAYSGRNGVDLRVYDCADPGCTSGAARFLDDANAVRIDIDLRADGTPIIAYADTRPGTRTLKIYDCFDVNCATGVARTPATDQGFTDHNVSVGVRSDGLPIVVAGEQTGFTNAAPFLIVLDCLDSGCAEGVKTVYSDRPPLTVDALIRTDDTALIAQRLTFRSCLDSGCAAADIIDGPYSITMQAMALRFPDAPFLVGKNDSRGIVAVDCNDASCTSNDSRTLDSTNIANLRDPRVALRPDGRPLVVYWESQHPLSEVLRVADCNDIDCTSNSNHYILSNDLFSDNFEG